MTTGTSRSFESALHRLQHLVAVHLRHHDVEQDQIEGACGQKVQRVPSVRGRHHVVVAPPFQPPCQRVAVVLVVVDDEQDGGRPRSCGSSFRQQRFDLCQQACEIDRLGVVVVATRGDRALPVTLHRVRRRAQ